MLKLLGKKLVIGHVLHTNHISVDLNLYMLLYLIIVLQQILDSLL